MYIRNTGRICTQSNSFIIGTRGSAGWSWRKPCPAKPLNEIFRLNETLHCSMFLLTGEVVHLICELEVQVTLAHDAAVVEKERVENPDCV